MSLPNPIQTVYGMLRRVIEDTEEDPIQLTIESPDKYYIVQAENVEMEMTEMGQLYPEDGTVHVTTSEPVLSTPKKKP